MNFESHGNGYLRVYVKDTMRKWIERQIQFVGSVYVKLSK